MQKCRTKLTEGRKRRNPTKVDVISKGEHIYKIITNIKENLKLAIMFSSKDVNRNNCHKAQLTLEDAQNFGIQSSSSFVSKLTTLQ